MREGVRRLTIALRWLSFAWLGGGFIYFSLRNEPLGHDLGSSVLTGAAIFAPGVIGLFVGWWLEDFADRS